MKSWKTLVTAMLSVHVFAVAAHAEGIADKVPLINGTEKAKHVFSIPGVTVNSVLGTFVSCTSLEKSKTMTIALEVWSQGPSSTAINDVGVGVGVFPSLLTAGETVMFEVTDTNTDLTWVNQDVRIVTGTLLHGSARVVATSTKLMCMAGFSDRTNALPTSIMPLPVISKTKQRGV